MLKYSNQILLAFFLLITCGSVFADIIIDKNNSPYKIKQDLTIAADQSLIIKEGAEIIISNGVNIYVNGILLIDGTPSDKVLIRPENDSIGWGRIIIDSKNMNCVIRNAIIIDGRIKASDINLYMTSVEFINRQDLAWNNPIYYQDRGTAKVENCKIVGIGVGEGIQFMATIDPSVKNCNFSFITDPVEFINVDDGLIRNNLFQDIDDDAIDLNNCTNTLIDSNIIINVADRGMEIGSENNGASEGIIVNRNVIVNCNEGVIFKEDSWGNLSNNTFYNNATAISAIHTKKKEGRQGSNVYVENSIFSESSINDFFTDELSSITAQYCLSDKNEITGEGNIYDKPNFVDPYIYDFHLSHGSPCIDNGNPDSDLDPDHTINDMGAYYFNTDTTSIQLTKYDVVEINIFPNPFVSSLTISYRLLKPGNVAIELFDLNGTKVKTLISEKQNIGNYIITRQLNTLQQLPNGYYVCSIKVNNSTKNYNLIKIPKRK